MKITHEIPIEVLLRCYADASLPLENPPVTEMPVSTEVDFSGLPLREGGNDFKLGAVRLFELVPGVESINTPVQFTSNYITWILRRSVTDSKLRRFKLCVDFCDSKTIVTRPYFPSIRVLPVPNNKISFQVDGKEVFGYCYSKEYLKPFFYPVIGPSGTHITRIGGLHDPMGTNENPSGHNHHRSITISHENVNGIPFETESIEAWRAAGIEVPGIGRQVHREVPVDGFESGPVFGGLRVMIDWLSHTSERLIEETRSVKLFSLSNGERIIDFDLLFRAMAEKVVFGKATHALLTVRVAEYLNVVAGPGPGVGGQIRSSEGGINQAGTNGKEARWCDYSGPVNDSEWNGIAIFDHPENLNHPCEWLTRDFGFMCPSAFGKEEKVLRKDEELKLKYRVFIHSGDADKAKIEERYNEYVKAPKIILQPEY